ncbi:AAA family ATPase [Nocardiopsis aegyptia]|uniref:helix-turn-helix transcriptional regulator n=1 Tax=Nocardiopsis aegyptia TaxID=220378 RepID=UPI003672F54F
MLGIMDDMSFLADTSPLFVGRTEQLRQLGEHALRARTEASGTMIIGGDAGVGKTRLVAEFTATRPVGTVFAGGCLELGVDGLAYAPFTAVLRQVLRERGREAFEAAAPGGTGEFARLLPELGALPQGGQEARGLLFEQVLRLFQAAAGDEGVTLVLEDLHWADGATRDLLVYLARNLDLPGVQIIATYRADDLHRTHPLRRLLPELERLPEVTRMALAPLTRDQVAEQVRAITGRPLPAARLDELYLRSDGIPLFVEALAAGTGGTDSDTDVPDHFRELLLGSLHRLDETAVAVLRVASVGAVSDVIGHATLARAAELPEPDLDRALHALVDANLLRVSGTGYRFRHALLREAVHDGLLPGPHARLHLRFAQLIDEYPDAVPADRRAAEQAHHFQAAHDLPRALQAAWWAAVRAGEVLARREELAMLERVLGLWERVPDAGERTGGRTRSEVLAAGAVAALDTGRPRRAWEMCDEGLAGLPGEPGTEDDHALTVRATLLRCRGQARSQCVDEGAVDDLAEALRLHPPHMPGFGLMLSILARETMFRPRGQTRLGASAVDLAERAHRVAEQTGDRMADAAALVTLGSVYMSRGEMARGRAIVERSIALSREIGDPLMEARGVGNIAHYLRERGEHRESLKMLDDALADHRRRGLMSIHSSFHHQNTAEAHFELGHLDTARAIVDGALDRSPSPVHRVFNLVPWTRAAVAQGDLAAARSGTTHHDLADARLGLARLDRVAALSVERLDQAQQAATAWLDLLLAEGDVAGAHDYALMALRRLELADSPGYGWTLLELAARCERLRRSASGPGGGADGGAADGEDSLRGRIMDCLAGMPVYGPVQSVQHTTVRAHLAEGVADPEEVHAAWAEAVSGWERTPLVLSLAGARLRAAEAAAAVGDRAAVRAWVGQVHAAAAEHGAVPLRRAAEDLARRASVPLKGGGAPEPPAVPAGLTARELEVLRLLSGGGTNAQIAAELFISPKTASVHVSNILAKLRVANRAAAGARARELGLA